jgi:hypothetical protein
VPKDVRFKPRLFPLTIATIFCALEVVHSLALRSKDEMSVINLSVGALAGLAKTPRVFVNFFRG